MSQHKCEGSDHVSKLASDAGFRDWQSIWDVNGSLQSRRKNPNILFKDRIHKGNAGLDRSDTITIPKSEGEAR